jgi:uncharacterized GH25 family protein
MLMLKHIFVRSAARGRLLATAAFVLAGAASIAAHDFWIEPSAFSIDAGNVLGIRLRVGENFLGEPMPRVPSLIDRFVVADMDGTRPIAGRDGMDPAGLLRTSAHGMATLGYLSKPSSITLAADKFNAYLAEEGLDAVIALRKQQRQEAAAGREEYRRCAKSLVLTGGVRPTDGDRVLGFPLELVAESNPYAAMPGTDLSFRLIYGSEPVAGALVVALNRAHPSQKLSQRTGKDGRVRFRLSEAGAWLIKSVHMTPAPRGSNVDWSSYWASLTFELPQAAIGQPRTRD